MGMSILAFLVALKLLSKRVKKLHWIGAMGPILACAIGIAAVAAGDLSKKGIKTVEKIPHGELQIPCSHCFFGGNEAATCAIGITGGDLSKKGIEFLEKTLHGELQALWGHECRLYQIDTNNAVLVFAHAVLLLGGGSIGFCHWQQTVFDWGSNLPDMALALNKCNCHTCWPAH